MPNPKTRSLRFSDDDWESLQSIAHMRGYSGPNALIAAIAQGEILLSDSSQPPDQRALVHALQCRLEGLQEYFRGVLPTDLP